MKPTIFDYMIIGLGLSALLGFYMVVYLVWDDLFVPREYEPIHIWIHSLDCKKIPQTKEIWDPYFFQETDWKEARSKAKRCL